jgi:hypothetical protein
MIAGLLLLCGCGPKAITLNSRPFPAEKPVFSDAAGRPLSDLPPGPENLRLVVLDFPWCPACADAWDAAQATCGTFPAGTVHLYRILFDQEVSLTSAGRRETPPRLPSGPGSPPGQALAEDTFSTTLTALPGAFRETYRVRQAPIVVLLARDGTVIRRWNGFSTRLADELAREIKSRTAAASPPPPGR